MINLLIPHICIEGQALGINNDSFLAAWNLQTSGKYKYNYIDNNKNIAEQTEDRRYTGCSESLQLRGPNPI